MAIKLADGIKTLGASLLDGNMSITILDKTWNIPVPVKQNYGYQLNEHNNLDVFTYLYNKETILVIRRDGTGSMMWKDTKVLIKNFFVEIPQELINGRIAWGGSAIMLDSGKATLATCYIIPEHYIGIYSMDDRIYSVVFDIRGAQEYVTDLALQQGRTYPTLLYGDGKFTKRSDPGDPTSRPLYTFSGKVIEHQTPMVLM